MYDTYTLPLIPFSPGISQRPHPPIADDNSTDRCSYDTAVFPCYIELQNDTLTSPVYAHLKETAKIQQPPSALETDPTQQMQFVSESIIQTITPAPTTNSSRILKHRLRKGKLKYLVQPAGFLESATTWIPPDVIIDTQLIDSYVNQPPTSSKTVSSTTKPPPIALLTL